MASFQAPDAIIITTSPERVALARRAHRSVKRTLFIIFGILALAIFLLGLFLSSVGRTSLAGIIGITAVFVAFPCFTALSVNRMERKAERFLATDGATQFSVGAQALTVGDTVLPYERITMMYAKAEGEQYSSGGIRGEVMAYRMDLSENRPGPGRAVGAAIGSRLRRRLYREGAKSTISLTIGVDHASSIAAPEGVMNGLRSLPKRGDDPGRIDVPFGAYLDFNDLQVLLGAVHRATEGRAFPIGVVSGAMNWEMALAAACEPRQKIWDEFPTLFPQA